MINPQLFSMEGLTLKGPLGEPFNGTISDKLKSAGCIINVVISQIATDDNPNPKSKSGLALIDTGSSHCAISQSVIEELGLVGFDDGIPSVEGMGDYESSPNYNCSFSFVVSGTTHLYTPQGVTLVKSFKEEEIALIGRDILQEFLLLYDGIHGFYTLAFAKDESFIGSGFHIFEAGDVFP